MSGFDFDGLRDPNAPRPGPRERADVDARARQLRVRTRRNRLAMSATSIVAVVAIVFGIAAVRNNGGPTISIAGPSSTPASSIADRFIPATSIANGIVTVAVTLPDGETSTLRYPTSLRIAQLGFGGTINVRWAVSGGASSCCGGSASIAYTSMARVFGSATPISVYTGADGSQVPFMHVPQNPGGGPYNSDEVLVFQFGPWLVVVQANTLTDQERATWARSLSGSVDANGYLLLHAASPLSIGNQFDGGFNLIDVGNFVRLSSHSNNSAGQIACGAGRSDTSAHRRRGFGANGSGFSWCVGDDLHVAVGGSASFIDVANKQLQVSALTAPSAVPTVTSTSTTPTTSAAPTTTTSLPAAPPSGAVSASFVSADQGFVLEQNGYVAATTDGGTTWHRVGTAGALGLDAKIRFIDAADGFIFGPSHASPALSITHDGGATWTALSTPFSAVSDLAISRGTVYVVGTSAGTTPAAGAFPGFRIWSSPVTHLNWAMDPLAIPAGAGPVPEQSLVLSGDAGWMVNNDRDFISGARLTATGRWTQWTPPCTGSAQVAAATSRDLVLACSPAYATSASATTIAFSHDGGDTFQPPSVPGTGFAQSGPLSPSADTAVVAVSGGLDRTTDGGATWHLVSPGDATRGFVDYGFTTPTQGFIIHGGSGEMLMTYDAGATWQKVMGP